MRIAFHATLKPPDHPVPSGDRRIARLFLQSLASISDVRLASRLSTRARRPDREAYLTLRGAADAEADRLIASYRSGDWRPDAWFTYHLYYKAPDWIGHAVSEALSIPYVVAEASYAAKRQRDHWSPWLADSVTQLEAANLIYCLTERDLRGVRSILQGDHVRPLPPFIDTRPFQAASPSRDDAGTVQLVSVAMMRADVKGESYFELARALAHLDDVDWHWHAVGHGVAADEVRAAFAALPPERVTWHGRLGADAVRGLLRSCDIYVWPGLGEGFGMAYLEAQACGLPVVAYQTAGVPDVVRDGVTGLLVTEATPFALAAALERLIGDRDLRRTLGANAHRIIRETHDLASVTETLRKDLRALVRSGA